MFRKLTMSNRRWTELVKNDAWTYIAVVVVLCLVSISALYRDGFIGGGDIWPGHFIPSNHLFDKAFTLWGSLFSGFGTPQYSATNFVWGLFGKVMFFFGFSGTFINYLFYAFLLVWQGVAIVYFVRQLYPGRPIVALVAALGVPLSLFNIITFINPIGAFSIGFFPWSAGLIYKQIKAKPSWLIFGGKLGFTTLGLFIISGTPPMAVVWVVWVIFWLIISQLRFRNIESLWKGLIVAIIIAILLNGWWAYGAYITLYKGEGAIEQTFAGALDYVWVHQNASLMNLLSMQGYWSWPQIAYYPFSYDYVYGWLKYSLYIPLLFVIVGLVYDRHKKENFIFFATLLITLFIAKGTHEPLGGVNRFLYEHLPFYWLLRDPQVEMNILLYLSMFTLAGVGVDYIIGAISGKFKLSIRIKSVVTAVAILLVSINGYSFVNGDFLPEKKDTGAFSAVFNIPPYWNQAAHYLNDSDNDGSRILMLPNNDFYQMPYDWDYYGTDELPMTLFKDPVINLQPTSDGYLGGASAFRSVLAQIQYAIESQSHEDITPLLRELGIKWVVHRLDVITTLPDHHILSQEAIVNYLKEQHQIDKVQEFGELVIYKVKQPGEIIQSYTDIGVMSGISPSAAESKSLIPSALPWLVDPTDIDGDSVQAQYQSSLESQEGSVNSPSGKTIIMPRVVSIHWKPVDSSQVDITLEGPISNGKPLWETTAAFQIDRKKYQNFVVDINGVQLPVETMGSTDNEEQIIGQIGIPADQSNMKISLFGSSEGNLFDNWGPLYDCNMTDKQSINDAGLSAVVHNGELKLKAQSHAACSRVEVGITDADGYYVMADYKHVSGTLPEISIAWNKKIVKKSELQQANDWLQEKEFISTKEQGKLSVVFYTFGNDKLQSENHYRNIKIWGLKKLANDSVPINNVSTEIVSNTMTSSTADHSQSGVLQSISQWTTDQSDAQLNQRGTNIQFNSEKDASLYHLIPNVNGQYLQFSGELRSKSEKSAMIKITDDQDTVLWQHSIDTSQEWVKFQKEMYISPDIKNVKVWLVINPNEGEEASVEYRKLDAHVIAAGAADYFAINKPVSPQKQTIQWSEENNRYKIKLQPDSKLLVLNTSYHSSWIVKSGDKKLNWTHTKIDGFINGWIIPDNNEIKDVTVEFAPHKTYDMLRIVSLLCILLGVGWIVFLWLRKRKRVN